MNNEYIIIVFACILFLISFALSVNFRTTGGNSLLAILFFLLMVVCGIIACGVTGYIDSDTYIQSLEERQKILEEKQKTLEKQKSSEKALSNGKISKKSFLQNLKIETKFFIANIAITFLFLLYALCSTYVYKVNAKHNRQIEEARFNENP